MRDNCLVLNGRQVQVAVPVDHSLSFDVGEDGTRKRTLPIQMGVMHWTAAENPAARVHETLHARGLSIHFILDRDGAIYQCADPALVVCSHAGRGVNDISWGVEIVNYGGVAKGRQPPAKGADRERYECVIHGHKRLCADFYAAQYTAIWELFDAVHRELGIPRGVYAGESTLVRWPQLRKFRGAIGHFHAALKKTDPGVRPLEWLAKRWAERPL